MGKSLLGSGNLFQVLWPGAWAASAGGQVCVRELLGDCGVPLSASVGVFGIFRSRMVAVFFFNRQRPRAEGRPSLHPKLWLFLGQGPQVPYAGCGAG